MVDRSSQGERPDQTRRDWENNPLSPNDPKYPSRSMRLTAGEIVLILDSIREYEARWMELEKTGQVQGFPKALVNRAAALKLGAGLIAAVKDGESEIVFGEDELWRIIAITPYGADIQAGRGVVTVRAQFGTGVTLLCKVMTALIDIENAGVIPANLRNRIDV